MATWFVFFHPRDKFRDFGMGEERFERVVVRFELFFCQYCMYLVVTIATYHENPSLDLFARKTPFIAFLSVSSAWDQVVPGQPLIVTFAQ